MLRLLSLSFSFLFPSDIYLIFFFNGSVDSLSPPLFLHPQLNESLLFCQLNHSKRK